jgi:signal transduction histidine kinase
MGKVISLNKLKVVVGLIIIVLGYSFSKFDFPKVDTLARDLLQLLNPAKVHSAIRTVNINTEDLKFARPLSLKSIQELIERIQAQSPKSVTLLLEPSEIIEDQRQAEDFLKYINSNANIFLGTSTSRSGKLPFNKHPILSSAKNFFDPPTATVDETIGGKDQKRRRTAITFEKTGSDQIFVELKKIGIEPKSPSYFQFPILIWNTTQLYFKTFRVGTFGNISSTDVMKDSNSQEFKDKIVLIGAFDEFSFFAKPSIFDYFDQPSSDNFSNSYFPYHEYIANVLHLFESGEYIKYIEVPDLSLVVSISLILIFLNIGVNLKITLFALLLPIIAWCQIVSYSLFSTYINFSHSIVFLAFIQAFLVPIVFIFTIRNIEQAKAHEVNQAKIQALESISEKLAHDIRSPLSTARLLLSKAKFEVTEHKDMVLGAISRIDSMTQEILNKSRGQLSSLAIDKIIEKLVLEKRALHPDVEIHFRKTGAVSYNIDQSDFERIVTNVLDNALAAVSRNGKINITLSSENNYLLLVVEDNGVGINEELLRTLGNSKVKTSKPDGNGIGLFHTKRILESYAGKLEIASIKNHGTKVSVFLPLMAG